MHLHFHMQETTRETVVTSLDPFLLELCMPSNVSDVFVTFENNHTTNVESEICRVRDTTSCMLSGQYVNKCSSVESCRLVSVVQP